jgi:hypothetical protein
MPEPVTWISAEARPLWLRLVRAVTLAESAGRPVPCRVDPAPFVADRSIERGQAAEACRLACPALDECSTFAAANREVWLVWGGEDRTPPTNNDARRRRRLEARARGFGDAL